MTKPRMICEMCAEGPSGIDGHDRLELVVTAVRAPGAIYGCADCHSVWNRTYEGSGIFVWIDLTGTIKAEPSA